MSDGVALCHDVALAAKSGHAPCDFEHITAEGESRVADAFGLRQFDSSNEFFRDEQSSRSILGGADLGRQKP